MFIWFHAVVHFLSSVKTSSYGLIFILRLSVRPLLGLVGNTASPYMCLRLHFGAAVIWPLGFFYKVYSKHLGLLVKIESSAAFLRVPLSVVFVRSFLGEDLKSPAIFLTDSAQSSSYVPSDLPRGIWSCIQVSDNWNACLVAFFWDLDFPKGSLYSWWISKVLGRTSCFPVSRVSKIISVTASRLWAMSW